MKIPFSRRGFLRGALTGTAAAGLLSLEERHLLAGLNSGSAGDKTPLKNQPTASIENAHIGKQRFSRLIAGGNLIGGWCHNRDLLYVSTLAKNYLTEKKQFETLMLLERFGVNAIVIDMIQLETINRYKAETGGKMQTIVNIRQDWGNWTAPSWPDLQEKIKWTIDQGPDTLYVHGGYADRVTAPGKMENIEILGRAIDFIREQGYTAGLGSHALEVPMALDELGVEPDYYVKTLHHDRYWSATPKEFREPFCVDGPKHLDHNKFHDNIFCLDADRTTSYMLEKSQPWIAFKVLAAGAIQPQSGFHFAFEKGADFIAVGMFDFQVEEDVETTRDVLKKVERERPWSL